MTNYFFGSIMVHIKQNLNFSVKNSLIIKLLLSKIIENKIITIFQLIKDIFIEQI